jgi:predicted NAD/FAD-dependent oxidoreductase
MARLTELTAAEQQRVVIQRTTVGSLARRGNPSCWEVSDEQGNVVDEHRLLVCAVPHGVAQRLLQHTGALKQLLPARADFDKARYAAAFRFQRSLGLSPLDFAIVPQDSSITVLLNDTSRLGSGGDRSATAAGAEEQEEVWVCQTSTDFADEKLLGSSGAGHRHRHPGDADDNTTVAAQLLEEFQRVVGGAGLHPLPPCLEMAATGWVYGDAGYHLEEQCVFDVERGLGLAGDWCVNGRVEGAWLSGDRVAHRILGELGLGGCS